MRPITFDHQVAKGRDDVVLVHLNHRLVQMCLRLMRAEVWAQSDVKKTASRRRSQLAELGPRRACGRRGVATGRYRRQAPPAARRTHCRRRLHEGQLLQPRSPRDAGQCLAGQGNHDPGGRALVRGAEKALRQEIRTPSCKPWRRAPAIDSEIWKPHWRPESSKKSRTSPACWTSWSGRSSRSCSKRWSRSNCFSSSRITVMKNARRCGAIPKP